jgi:hypothetical protein
MRVESAAFALTRLSRVVTTARSLAVTAAARAAAAAAALFAAGSWGGAGLADAQDRFSESVNNNAKREADMVHQCIIRPNRRPLISVGAAIITFSRRFGPL